MLEAVPPFATLGRTVLWWQGTSLTYFTPNTLLQVTVIQLPIQALSFSLQHALSLLDLLPRHQALVTASNGRYSFPSEFPNWNPRLTVNPAGTQLQESSPSVRASPPLNLSSCIPLLKGSVKVIVRPTASRPVSSGIRPPHGTRDLFFFLKFEFRRTHDQLVLSIWRLAQDEVILFAVSTSTVRKLCNSQWRSTLIGTKPVVALGNETYMYKSAQ
jgi:hypothetical protein